MRVYKSIIHKIQYNETELNIDEIMKNFYINQSNQYVGMTINAVARESEIPRTTVKRIIENLINNKLLQRNNKNYIIPTDKVREYMTNYRQYIYKQSLKNIEYFIN